MRLGEYSAMVKRLAAGDTPAILDRIGNIDTVQLLHAIIGIAGESGELIDIIKRDVYYGHGIDKTNVIEELGDALWYIQHACNVIGVTMHDVIDANAAKLMQRYGARFTEDKANNRNLDAERKALEGEAIEAEDYR